MQVPSPYLPPFFFGVVSLPSSLSLSLGASEVDVVWSELHAGVLWLVDEVVLLLELLLAARASRVGAGDHPGTCLALCLLGTSHCGRHVFCLGAEEEEGRKGIWSWKYGLLIREEKKKETFQHML